MAWVNIIDLMYPVGTIYYADNNLNPPAAVFGGTWVVLTTSPLYSWKRTA